MGICINLSHTNYCSIVTLHHQQHAMLPESKYGGILINFYSGYLDMKQSYYYLYSVYTHNNYSKNWNDFLHGSKCRKYQVLLQFSYFLAFTSTACLTLAWKPNFYMRKFFFNSEVFFCCAQNARLFSFVSVLLLFFLLYLKKCTP